MKLHNFSNTANSPKDYFRLKIILIFILVFYFIAGLSTEILLPGREKDFPPFFSWFLFDTVPNERYNAEYTVKILEVNGKILIPAVLWGDAWGIVDDPLSPKARTLIRNLGYNLERQNQQEGERSRLLLEQIYLPPSVRYQVVVITYNPLERYQKGKFYTRVLGEFNKK